MEIEKLLKIRSQRGYEIAKLRKILRKKNIWFVPSETNPRKMYEVLFNKEGISCTCDDYLGRNLKCKHIFAVEFTVQKGATEKLLRKKIYPQNWKAYDAASTEQKDLFMKLLYELCSTIEEQKPKATGRPRLPLASMVFLSGLKVYTNFSLRRFMSDAEKVAKAIAMCNGVKKVFLTSGEYGFVVAVKEEGFDSTCSKIRRINKNGSICMAIAHREYSKRA